MRLLKLIFPIFLIAILSVVHFNGNAQAQENSPPELINNATYWTIEKTSHLEIHGTTNINEYRCELSTSSLADTLSFTPDYKNTALVFENSDINLSVNEFNCHNPLITSDFRKTLKAEEYPYIKIIFKKINIRPDIDLTQTDGEIEIELGGIKNQYSVFYQISETDDNAWLLEGHQNLTFKDFNIEPPSRILNLIKVNDEIAIQFKLVLRQIQP